MSKNEIELFNNEELGLSVRTILNDDGSISINAEDAARGFGWTTVAKSGNVVIRWARVNGYCKEFGFPNKLGKDDYIPESLFYRLGMKANNKVADKFQNWLAIEVIPSIRKNGFYTENKFRQDQQTFKPQGHPLLVNPWMAEMEPHFKFLCKAYGYDRRGLYHRILVDVGMVYNLEEYKIVYKYLVGHEHRYIMDVVAYFPELREEAEKSIMFNVERKKKQYMITRELDEIFASW